MTSRLARALAVVATIALTASTGTPTQAGIFGWGCNRCCYGPAPMYGSFYGPRRCRSWGGCAPVGCSSCSTCGGPAGACGCYDAFASSGCGPSGCGVGGCDPYGGCPTGGCSLGNAANTPLVPQPQNPASIPAQPNAAAPASGLNEGPRATYTDEPDSAAAPARTRPNSGFTKPSGALDPDDEPIGGPRGTFRPAVPAPETPEPMPEPNAAAPDLPADAETPAPAEKKGFAPVKPATPEPAAPAAPAADKKDDAGLAAPRTINADDKVAWKPQVELHRTGVVRTNNRNAKLVRVAVYAQPKVWTATPASQIASK